MRCTEEKPTASGKGGDRVRLPSGRHLGHVAAFAAPGEQRRWQGLKEPLILAAARNGFEVEELGMGSLRSAVYHGRNRAMRPFGVAVAGPRFDSGQNAQYPRRER